MLQRETFLDSCLVDSVVVLLAKQKGGNLQGNTSRGTTSGMKLSPKYGVGSRQRHLGC